MQLLMTLLLKVPHLLRQAYSNFLITEIQVPLS